MLRFFHNAIKVLFGRNDVMVAFLTKVMNTGVTFGIPDGVEKFMIWDGGGRREV